jgi:PEP-CTERM motif-containing protein
MLPRSLTALLAVGCSLASLAHATTTSVNPLGGGDGSERCLQGGTCSGGAYGGAFSLISLFEKDLNLAPGSLTRVDDDFDKLWTNTITNGGQVQALARYASDNSRLGYDAGTGFVPVTSILTNKKVLVNHSASFFGDSHASDLVTMADTWLTLPLVAGVPFAFVLEDQTMNYRITTNPLSGVGSSGYANSGLGTLDYMVTYRVPDTMPHYFVAWEDRNPTLANTGDHDYNDFVAEIRFANPIPEPETYAMLLAGFGLLGFAARRRGQTWSEAS